MRNLHAQAGVSPNRRTLPSGPFANGGVQIRPGGALPFFGAVLLHKKNLGHPAQKERPETFETIIKLGFHPHARPTRPKRGLLRIARPLPPTRIADWTFCHSRLPKLRSAILVAPPIKTKSAND